MLSVPSPSQKPGRGYPSRGGYLDRFFELGSKIVIRRCLKEGSWFRQDCIFRCCYSEVPQKRLFCAHETPLSQKARFVAILTGCGQRSQPGIANKITYLAVEWRSFIAYFGNESRRRRLLRELAPPRLCVLFRGF